MVEGTALGGFLALSVVVSVAWGLALRYFDERSQALRRAVFFALGFTRRPPSEVRALFLSAIYYGLGLLASLLCAVAFGLGLSSLFTFSATHIPLVVLGVVGQISLTSLLVDLACRVSGQGRPEQFAEVQEIPWIKGLRALPAATVPAAAAFGGVVEELFFRGVLLRIMTDVLMVAPLVAVAIAAGLFCLEQLLQVRTPFQMLLIGAGCVAISSIGGLLVVLTGSVVPAVLCHASFVVFHMARPNGVDAPAATSGRDRTEATS
jgi:membrane protease YdiL (CAAX protease family)